MLNALMGSNYGQATLIVDRSPMPPARMPSSPRAECSGSAPAPCAAPENLFKVERAYGVDTAPSQSYLDYRDLRDMNRSLNASCGDSI
jgi:hypothetical protein